jgi:hypothetical protein
VSADNETNWTELAPPDRRAFSASEMVECSACSRANPPTRSNCLYCGAALAVSATNLVRFESADSKSEQGSLSHVVITNPEINETALAELSKISNLSTTELETLLSSLGSGISFGIVDPAQAELICQRLRELGVEAFTIADEQLKLDSLPKDVRALEFRDDSLIGVSRRGGEGAPVPWTDVVLIVVGRLRVTTMEIEEKKTRGGSRMLAERELSTDEAVLDIYTRNDEIGWRIRSGSFDFSCLGDDKSITAFQNFTALTNVLRDRAVNADVDSAYDRLRSLLVKMWPSEEPEGKTERRRAGLRDFHATITSTDNLNEFTRYSRLRRFLKQRGSPRV